MAGRSRPYVLKAGVNVHRVPDERLQEGITHTRYIARFLHDHEEHTLAAAAEELVMIAEEELQRRSDQAEVEHVDRSIYGF